MRAPRVAVGPRRPGACLTAEDTPAALARSAIGSAETVDGDAPAAVAAARDGRLTAGLSGRAPSGSDSRRSTSRSLAKPFDEPIGSHVGAAAAHHQDDVARSHQLGQGIRGLFR